ncbi:Transcriptional regulator, AraC family [Rubellimicrobium mesophilum DSM 19309]|uniref:Transcriptional regulator, AraC family n=1 Tax=Rubellimicrobium mesophilum DSM 19309 TaxID=442562 RepID=A0A017HPU5_9RHOB|nr:AraC family transcriptional regulator [Rubellimicrobium mesophilum]EYD76173.1 Transcriptional regulator, AraC family [Rubellimicrobium mesophilum DSM 19309]
MTATEAQVVARVFEPAPAQRFQMPCHYLLHAEQGALLLEAGGLRWTLPPARAALVAADEPVLVSLPQRVVACSALFSPSFVSDPPTPLSVFDMSPLGRELLKALRGVDGHETLDSHATALFRALAEVAWALSRTPSPAVMPVARSPQLRRALALMEARLDQDQGFEALAAEVALSPRSLARRFSGEMALTWRQALRRLRMVRAVELLAQDGLSITEVGMSVGYASLSAFNAAFRDFAGQTPSDYRASFRS